MARLTGCFARMMPKSVHLYTIAQTTPESKGEITHEAMIAPRPLGHGPHVRQLPPAP